MANVIVCLRVENSEKVRRAPARSDARTPKHAQLKIEREREGAETYREKRERNRDREK